MKIVLPVHHFPPRHSAGAELYTFRLARWLQEQQHEVEVVALDRIDEGALNELRAVHDSYEGVPVWRLSFNIFATPERRIWDFDNPLLGAWFRDYFERERPDIAHFQAGYLLGVAPLRAAAEAGVASVLTLHDYWFLCPRHTLQRGDGALCEQVPENPAGCAWCRCTEQRRYQLADRFSRGLAGKAAQTIVLSAQAGVVAERRARVLPALALPDAVIAPSRFLAQRFASFVPPERLIVTRYGLDLSRFAGLKRHAADDTLHIGFTGQIAEHKGVHLLVEAFRRLAPNGRALALHLYGGLDAYPAYVERLRKLAGGDERIHFHGRFDNRKAAEILAGLDVAVVPSVWYENSPLAIMEAQAAGVPVVTAALGGMAELVRDGVDGLHFRAADAGDLARQLQRLVDEQGLLPRLRAGVVPPRSIADEMRELSALYERLQRREVGVVSLSV